MPKSIFRVFVIICFLLTLLIPPLMNNGYQNDMYPVHKNMQEPQSQFDVSSIDFETMNYTVVSTPDSFESYLLCVLYQRNRITGKYSNSLIVMAHNGTILSTLDVGQIGNFQCPAEFITPDTVLFGTATGAALWHINNDTYQYLSFIGHHEYEYNPNSNTIFTFELYRPYIDGAYYQFDYIREYALNGTLVWSLDVHDFISEDWWCPYGDVSGIYRDVSHSNTAFYDAEEDIIYYNSRNTNTFWKINHTSSEIIWGLGEYGNFTLYNIRGELRDNLFSHAHAVEKINDNTFILFDNDHHNLTDPENKISRLVKITVDENTMTANETWNYSFPREYFSYGMGDADVLPNGNVLGDSGYIYPEDGILSSAFVEVNQQGDVVWETDFYYNPTYIYGAYRIERFRYEPIITPVEDFENTNGSFVIDWDVFYNYRNKEKLPGDYFLYVDDVQVEAGSFTYEQFWQPTTLSLSPGTLSFGLHNVTLEITDGYGHSQIDSVNVTVGDFFIERSGDTTVEKGQQTNLPTWRGASVSPLTYNITLNESLHIASTWTGDDIVLNPDTIDIGLHNVTFRMFNGSEELYTDSFWFRVYPSAPPEIIPLQSLSLSMDWNGSLSLNWNITDATGHSWNLYLNESVITSGFWSPPFIKVTWKVPVLDYGLYNITLSAEDIVGQQSSSTSWLTVHPPPHPVIISSPGNQTIVWGATEVVLLWEVYIGTTWEIKKNGVVYRSGSVSDDNVTLDDIDWIEEAWRPGSHNLTLILYLDDLFTVDTIFVTIILDQGDPFADDYVPAYSSTCLNSSNAIGAPDSNSAIIYIDYSSGYLTLDMGQSEEILDGSGDDFWIVASGDSYSVFIAQTLDTPFIYLGVATGSSSFDISSTGLQEVRYVRIAITSGVDVLLDAVVAHYYNVPSGDDEAPVIQSLDDSSMIIGDVLSLNWTATDYTPWEYEIYINGTLAESGSWNGGSIEYLFEPTELGLWNITLVLYDAYDNTASDSVFITVNQAPTTVDFSPLVIVVGIGLGVVTIATILFIYKKKR